MNVVCLLQEQGPACRVQNPNECEKENGKRLHNSTTFSRKKKKKNVCLESGIRQAKGRGSEKPIILHHERKQVVLRTMQTNAKQTFANTFVFAMTWRPPRYWDLLVIRRPPLIIWLLLAPPNNDPPSNLVVLIITPPPH